MYRCIHKVEALFFQSASEIKAVDPDYARGYKIIFSDEYPFLLLSQVRQFDR